MPLLQTAFKRVSAGSRISLNVSLTFWFALWALAIDDEQQAREKERKKKHALTSKPPHPF